MSQLSEVQQTLQRLQGLQELQGLQKLQKLQELQELQGLCEGLWQSQESMHSGKIRLSPCKRMPMAEKLQPQIEIISCAV